MGERTAIEWTDHTFNPWWGCTRVSPGCQHCYAEAFAKRTGHDVWGKNAPRRFFGDKHWAEPLKWDANAKAEGVRRRVFCASMADVFEDESMLDDDPAEQMRYARERLWSLIGQTPNLDWLLLTKRPGNVLDMVPDSWLPTDEPYPCGPHGQERCGCDSGRWPVNVWVGTTVEDQQRADERISLLQSIPAPVRFLSCEPLVGPVDLRGKLDGIHWVIAGGESGHGARPMHPDWVRAIRDEVTETKCLTCNGLGWVIRYYGFDPEREDCPDCIADHGRGCAFLFKQWGDWAPQPVTNVSGPGGELVGTQARVSLAGPWHRIFEAEPSEGIDWTWHHRMRRAGKKAAGRVLDGRTWDEVPS